MEYTNPRAVRSRSALLNALRCLLQERNYSDIPITHVVREAGVGYTTFYRHYGNYNDLLVDLMQTYAESLTTKLRLEKTLYDESVALYSFIRDHKDLMRIYLKLPASHPARDAARKGFHALIAERYAARSASEVPFDLSIAHIVDATHQMIAFYLEHLGQYSPQDIANMHIKLVVEPTVHFMLDVREPWLEHHDILQPA